LPLGVYATDTDFVDYCLRDEALIQRARLAVQRALPLVELTRHARSAITDEVVAA
jgi:FMN reductase